MWWTASTTKCAPASLANLLTLSRSVLVPRTFDAADAETTQVFPSTRLPRWLMSSAPSPLILASLTSSTRPLLSSSSQGLRFA